MQFVTRLAGVAALASAIVLAAIPVASAQYPDRTVTILVPFAAGGTTDVVARIMGDAMSRIIK